MELTLSAANRCANPSTTITANPSGVKPDNYVVQWMDEDNNPIGSGLTIEVIPSQLSTYRATLTLSAIITRPLTNDKLFES